MDSFKDINGVKSKFYFFMICCFLFNSCAWQKTNKDVILETTGIKDIVSLNEGLINCRHNLDRGSVEFEIDSFEMTKFEAYDANAEKNGWCVIANLENERTYMRAHEENIFNAEIVSMVYDDRLESLLVLITTR